MSNLPVLYQNVCSSLESDAAQKAFIWAADTRDQSRCKYTAETYAREVQALDQVRPLITEAGKTHGLKRSTAGDLMRFVLKRHANHRFGGNVKMWWEDAA